MELILKKNNSRQDMDPRLQLLLERRLHGVLPVASTSTVPGEIAVIAKVRDVQEWRNLSEVHLGAVLGRSENGSSAGYITTARVPLLRLQAIRNHPTVISLKPAQGVTTALSETVPEIGAKPTELTSVGGHDVQGDGVIVGVVDFGCDFAHQNFRNADGSSRLLAIWDQEGQSIPQSPFGYGREFTREQINAALKEVDPYEALGYGPQVDPQGTHGTHVLDIAAGNGLGSHMPGVAPNADLIFVEVASTDIPWSGADVVGKSFGDSVQLLEALRYIFDRAEGRPCVINVSLGTNGGPHDGSTLVEQGIDALLNEAPDRAVVIAASNSYADGIHAAGTVAAGAFIDLVWEVTNNDSSHNEFELWYSGADEFALEIIDPDGTSVASLGLGENGSLVNEAGVLQIFAAHRSGDPNNGDNVIGVFLQEGLLGGAWVLRIHGINTPNGGGFHAWIERDDSSPSRFAAPQDNSHTLGSISCGHFSIAVGSYDAHKKPQLPLSWFSSEGPTRDGREKPEISAPGHDVWAARSRTKNGVVRKSGTSMAAPAVTGAVAVVMSEANARGRSLTITDIHTLLNVAARPGPPNFAGGATWDPRYGRGRIDVAGMIRNL